ncbi:hypothetical protein DSM3645_06941 [Blastopirellula marina DSM 3645]|uniref:Uncharacterized protein n=1 Tax=Blastopirellula marina DSM 3645 TaxID=314230 RepID=A3ZYF7_9BACT|nr:hypothetical protein DSM3645_06941 [Blastopirellula marina DSM 3645]
MVSDSGGLRKPILFFLNRKIDRGFAPPTLRFCDDFVCRSEVGTHF